MRKGARAFKMILPALLALSILSLLSTSVLAGGGMMQGQSAPGNGIQAGAGGMGGPGNGMWKDQSGYMNGGGHQNAQQMQETMQFMMGNGMKMGFFGRLNYSDGVAEGRFIAFHLNESTGVITDYQMKRNSVLVNVFDSLSVDGFIPTNISTYGSVMSIRNASVIIIIHDNPTAMFHVVANGTVQVTMDLASGLNVSSIPSPYDSAEVLDHALLVHGKGVHALIGTDHTSLNISGTPLDYVVKAQLADDHLMFRSKPLLVRHHWMHEDALERALERHRLGAEMSLMVYQGNALYETMEYDRALSLQVIKAERNRIQLQVSSDEHQGKVILVNLDRDTLDVIKGTPTVRLDGSSIRQTSNPLEVLEANGSTAGDAVYCIVSSGDVAQVMVYVPSFSTHEISIESALPLDQVAGLAGIMAVGGALAVIAVAALVLVRRKG